MKDKNDTKTMGLALAKTNAERQQEYRDRQKSNSKEVRINCYISVEADKHLSKIMVEHGLSKKDALSTALEILEYSRFQELLREGRKHATSTQFTKKDKKHAK